MIKIINLNNVDDIEGWLKTPGNTYIGRETKEVQGSKWGNPYIVSKSSSKSYRKQVLKQYEKYVLSNVELSLSLRELEGKTLGCWCSPKLCHGLVLKHLTEKTTKDLPTQPQHSNAVINMSTPTVSLDSTESIQASQSNPPNQPSVPTISNEENGESGPSEGEDIVSRRTREMLEFFNTPLNDSDIVINEPRAQTEPEMMQINSTQAQINVTFQQQISSIQQRLSQVVGAYNVLQADYNTLKNQFKHLQAHSNQQRKTVFDLENDLTSLQQYNRRENIEIMGIPNTVADSELEAKVVSILNSIGCNISSYDIVACHRLKSRNFNQSYNTIVRFTNRKISFYALQNRKHLKWHYPAFPNLYIVENLCPRNKSIFEKCQELKREGKIKYVWSYNGVVHYKTHDDQSNYGTKVFNMSELNQRFNIHPQLDGVRNTNRSGSNG